ncbi:MAG: hypothetical protein Q8L60_15725 [Gammaproteobacteria bacterium]|nr:hypothetical protein [Gammaproteobacteria bacterium]MDP2139533.1 hypothetical protein [Gammaproteobacteria bacterium]MDP2346506.1 hypothetical protein [Gammaproteobacteria bacterium]
MPAVTGGQSGSTTVPAGIPGSPGVAGSSQPSSSGQRAGAGGQVSASGATGAGGNYSLDTLPGGLGDSGTGPMTAQERAAVLNGTLNSGYEEFDGFILAERARAQAEANAARTAMPGGSGGGSSSAGGGGEPIIVAARPVGGTSGPQGAAGAGGGSSSQGQTFPPPEDIPSGRDDDIVARQLREAAMSEPDPELRERLWDEYRRYTGIGG